MKKAITYATIFATAILALSACTDNTTTKEQQNVTNSTTAQQDDTNESDGNEVTAETLKDLLNKKQNLKCTWSAEDSKGVVYISDNKTRTEVTVLNVEGAEQPVVTNMIDNGQWLYTWNDAAPMGTKMNLTQQDEMMDQEKMMDMDEDFAIDAVEEESIMNEPLGYKCVKWTVEPKMFVPPTTVKFQDMQELIKNMGAPMQQNNNGIVPE